MMMANIANLIICAETWAVKMESTPDDHYYLCTKTELNKNDMCQKYMGENVEKEKNRRNYPWATEDPEETLSRTGKAM